MSPFLVPLVFWLWISSGGVQYKSAKFGQRAIFSIDEPRHLLGGYSGEDKRKDTELTTKHFVFWDRDFVDRQIITNDQGMQAVISDFARPPAVHQYIAAFQSSMGANPRVVNVAYSLKKKTACAAKKEVLAVGEVRKLTQKHYSNPRCVLQSDVKLVPYKCPSVWRTQSWNPAWCLRHKWCPDKRETRSKPKTTTKRK